MDIPLPCDVFIGGERLIMKCPSAQTYTLGHPAFGSPSALGAFDFHDRSVGASDFARDATDFSRTVVFVSPRRIHQKLDCPIDVSGPTRSPPRRRLLSALIRVQTSDMAGLCRSGGPARWSMALLVEGHSLLLLKFALPSFWQGSWGPSWASNLLHPPEGKKVCYSIQRSRLQLHMRRVKSLQ